MSIKSKKKMKKGEVKKLSQIKINNQNNINQI
jgi:hypothetical protein